MANEALARPPVPDLSRGLAASQKVSGATARALSSMQVPRPAGYLATNSLAQWTRAEIGSASGCSCPAKRRPRSMQIARSKRETALAIANERLEHGPALSRGVLASRAFLPFWRRLVLVQFAYRLCLVPVHTTGYPADRTPRAGGGDNGWKPTMSSAFARPQCNDRDLRPRALPRCEGVAGGA